MRRRIRSTGALAALLLSSTCGNINQDDDITTESSAVTWDGTSRPIGKTFLHFRAAGTKCCKGQKASQCSTTCSDGAGLITQAGYDKADDYYQVSGQGSLTTLEAFKAAYNVPRPLVGESLTHPSYRSRAHIVVYYNPNELGLGRELGCGEKNAGDPAHYAVGCYVTNFGDSFASMNNPNGTTNREVNVDGTFSGLHAAVAGIEPKGTVVISYDASRPAGYRVQFGAYGPGGERVNKAQLDNMGPRPIPQICTSCHGGNWDGEVGPAPFGMAKGARFLPLVTSSVVFPVASESPGLTQADQEERVRYVNELAWKARSEALTKRQQEALMRMYTAWPTTVCATFTTSSSCTTSHPHCTWQTSPAKCIDVPADGNASLSPQAPNAPQNAMAIAPPGYSLSTNATGLSMKQNEFYRRIILRNCDTCHMALEDGSYTAFDSWANFTGAASTLRTYMGLSTSGNPATWSANTFFMPHAQNLQSRFWADTGGVEGTTPVCSIGGVLKKPVDCMLAALGTARPTDAIPTQLQAQGTTNQPDIDCGQQSKDLKLNGPGVTGYNSGRRAVGGLCQPGCRKATSTVMALGCPGSEQIQTFLDTGEWHGTRQECVPQGLSAVGTCKSCGRINQPACTQVGLRCDANFNASCNRLPACHEGVMLDIGFGPRCYDDPLSGTAAQSSLWMDETPEKALDGDLNTYAGTNGGALDFWTMDLLQPRHVTSLAFYNSPDLSGLQGFLVLYVGPNGWTTFQGGDFTYTGQASAGPTYTYIRLPEPVLTSRIMIETLSGPYLEIAEVSVNGW